MTEPPIKKLLRVYKLIYSNWVTTNGFQYVVRPSHAVAGKPIDEIRDARFWVGVHDGGEGGVFTLGELIGLFRLIADQVAQIRKAQQAGSSASGGTPSYQSDVNVNPPDDMIEKTLKQIRFAEPGPVE